MEIRIAVSKINKHGAGKSGDTVESIERPNGGFSIVIADGQINGSAQKSISTMVCHRVIDHISNGVRDGAAIRATSSRLYSESEGSIQADLNVVSVDLQTNTIIISRNNPVPVYLINQGRVDCLESFSESIGTRSDISPTIVELEIQPNMAVIVFSDGAYKAGQLKRRETDVRTMIKALIEEQDPLAQELADHLLHRAIRLDDGRPKDDMSVLVMQISPRSTDQIRRMNVSMTIDE